jgi:hypothetical protein
VSSWAAWEPSGTHGEFEAAPREATMTDPIVYMDHFEIREGSLEEL